jgi:hypothetical protein
VGSSVRRSIPVLFVALVALLSGCKSTHDVASSTSTTAVGRARLTQLSADKLLGQARRTASRRKWVHVESQGRDPKLGAVTIVGDAGPNAGRQTLTTDEYKVSLVYVKNAVYVRGNGDLVAGLLGLPQSSAPAVEAKWVLLRPTDAPYEDAVDGVPLSSMLDDMAPSTPLTKAGPIDVRGEPTMRISGEDRRALFVSVRTGLPVSFSESDPDSSVDGTFSHWGEPVALRAPKGAIAFASVPR